MIGTLWTFIYIGPDGRKRESHIVTPHEDIIMAASVADRAALQDAAGLPGEADVRVIFLETSGTGFLSDVEALMAVAARDYSPDDVVYCGICGNEFDIATGHMDRRRGARKPLSRVPEEEAGDGAPAAADEAE